jgi:hypothetical protein
MNAALDAARAIQMIHCALDTAIANQPAANIGLYAAEITLANLDAPADLRLKAVSITNRSLLLRAQADAGHGHSPNLDLIATEAVLNPIHVGMVLAGANCDATDAITPYALAAGRLYVSGETKYLADLHTRRKQLTFWSQAELLLVDSMFDAIRHEQ